TARSLRRIWESLCAVALPYSPAKPERSSAEPVALEPDDGEIKGGQELGSITRLERLRTAGDLPGRSQILHQIACRERHAYRRFRQDAPRGRDHLRPGLYAAMRERYIGRDDDASA